jgi:hypothetical protein
VYYYRPCPYPNSNAYAILHPSNVLSGPKPQKRRRLVCVSPPPPLPSTALLRCAAPCALGRGPVCEGVAAGWRASPTTRRTAFAPRPRLCPRPRPSVRGRGRGLACQSDYPSGCLCPPPALVLPQLDPGRGFNAGMLSPSAPASCCSGSIACAMCHVLNIAYYICTACCACCMLPATATATHHPPPCSRWRLLASLVFRAQSPGLEASGCCRRAFPPARLFGPAPGMACPSWLSGY